MVRASDHRRPSGPWLRTMVGAFLVFLLAAGAVEGTLRALGYDASVTDDNALWALTYRDRQPDEWLILGSSRSACALDAATITRMTGEPVRNLALTGGSALPVIERLDAQGFDGKLLVEVSPALMFSSDASVEQHTASALAALDAQKSALFGATERRALVALQSHLRLLHSEMDLMDLVRGAVRGQPPVVVNRFDADRQRQCWMSRNGVLPDLPAPDPSEVATERAPAAQARMDAFIDAVSRIQARGGSVLLWQPPEGSDKLQDHLRNWPDALWFDVVAERSGVPAVNVTIDPELSAFPVPDGSHLDADDALVFTELLVRRYQQDGRLPSAE